MLQKYGTLICLTSDNRQNKAFFPTNAWWLMTSTGRLVIGLVRKTCPNPVV